MSLFESDMPIARDPFGAFNSIEIALADAIAKAVAAGRFDIVSELARELEARRLFREKPVLNQRKRHDR